MIYTSFLDTKAEIIQGLKSPRVIVSVGGWVDDFLSAAAVFSEISVSMGLDYSHSVHTIQGTYRSLYRIKLTVNVNPLALDLKLFIL